MISSAIIYQILISLIIVVGGILGFALFVRKTPLLKELSFSHSGVCVVKKINKKVQVITLDYQDKTYLLGLSDEQLTLIDTFSSDTKQGSVSDEA